MGSDRRSSGWLLRTRSSSDRSAAQIAAAAEVYAQEEGVVWSYSDETPGRELVEQARAALPADDLTRSTELGKRLTIDEALELARGAGVVAESL